MSDEQRQADLAWAWSKNLTSHQKLVLLALVWVADLDGVCDAPIGELAEMTGLPPESVVALRADLYQQGLVTADGPIKIKLPELCVPPKVS